jgi:hypothetical protein
LATTFNRSESLRFFLLRLFEGQNLQQNYQTEEELEEGFRREIANIPAEQLQRVNQQLFRQCGECPHVEGPHFQYLLCSVN